MTMQKPKAVANVLQSCAAIGSSALKHFVTLFDGARTSFSEAVGNGQAAVAHLLRLQISPTGSGARAARAVRSAVLNGFATFFGKEEHFSAPQARLRQSITRNVRLGMAAVFLLVGVGGLWAATNQLSGAVVAAGHLVVDFEREGRAAPAGRRRRSNQCENGTMVTAGDVVVRLDDTLAGANLAIVRTASTNLLRGARGFSPNATARRAMVYPEGLIARNAHPHVRQLVEGRTGCSPCVAEQGTARWRNFENASPNSRRRSPELRPRNAGKSSEIELIKRTEGNESAVGKEARPALAHLGAGTCQGAARGREWPIDCGNGTKPWKDQRNRTGNHSDRSGHA